MTNEVHDSFRESLTTSYNNFFMYLNHNLSLLQALVDY